MINKVLEKYKINKNKLDDKFKNIILNYYNNAIDIPLVELEKAYDDCIMLDIITPKMIEKVVSRHLFNAKSNFNGKMFLDFSEIITTDDFFRKEILLSVILGSKSDSNSYCPEKDNINIIVQEESTWSESDKYYIIETMEVLGYNLTKNYMSIDDAMKDENVQTFKQKLKSLYLKYIIRIAEYKDEISIIKDEIEYLNHCNKKKSEYEKVIKLEYLREIIEIVPMEERKIIDRILSNLENDIYEKNSYLGYSIIDKIPLEWITTGNEENDYYKEKAIRNFCDERNLNINEFQTYLIDASIIDRVINIKRRKQEQFKQMYIYGSTNFNDYSNLSDDNKLKIYNKFISKEFVEIIMEKYRIIDNPVFTILEQEDGGIKKVISLAHFDKEIIKQVNSSYIHEICHGIESNVKKNDNNELILCTGFEEINLSNNEEKRPYEAISEVIHSMIENDIIKIYNQHNPNFKINEQKSLYNKSIYLLEPLFDFMKSDILNARYHGNMNIIYDKIGKNNFDSLAILIEKHQKLFEETVLDNEEIKRIEHSIKNIYREIQKDNNFKKR